MVAETRAKGTVTMLTIRDVSSQTKATLELLVAEIQMAMADAGPTGTEQHNAVKSVLDQWIEGSQLHPERVQNISERSVTMTTERLGTEDPFTGCSQLAKSCKVWTLDLRQRLKVSSSIKSCPYQEVKP